LDFPILEFDPDRKAVIEPHHLLRPLPIPEYAVPCFFQEVIQKIITDFSAKVLLTFKSEFGENPLYQINYNGKNIAVFHPGVGAPLAAGFLEEAIALGCKKFIACGGSGVLDRSISVGHLLVPTTAIRDEGTSYHYLAPAREVSAHPDTIKAIQATLDDHSIPYLLSKTWTTDAFYRETTGKVSKRKTEGCLTVEMEAAAFFAVAEFRGVKFGQILYAGDDVSMPEWDHRGWQDRSMIRERVFWLAVESCLRL
jgi:uridine phosphorylase